MHVWEYCDQMNHLDRQRILTDDDIMRMSKDGRQHVFGIHHKYNCNGVLVAQLPLVAGVIDGVCRFYLFSGEYIESTVFVSGTGVMHNWQEGNGRVDSILIDSRWCGPIRSYNQKGDIVGVSYSGDGCLMTAKKYKIWQSQNTDQARKVLEVDSHFCVCTERVNSINARMRELEIAYTMKRP